MHQLKLVSLFFLIVAAGATRGLGAPEEVKRVVRTFDFEERRLGNHESLPMHWNKVEGPGMPHYVNGRLTTDLAHSGQYSFRLDLDGGSVAYRYAANRIHVMAGAHYRVEGLVKTTVLPHARARLSTYLADLDGHLLPGTTHHSEPYAAKAQDEDWHRIELELSVDDPKAAYLVLEMGLLQPSIYAEQTLGQRTLTVQDIRGTAWFDDITVSQVPRVTMATDQPANVFPRGTPIRLLVQIDDRFTDDLAAQIAVVDAEGKLVYQRSGTTELGQAQTISAGRKRLTVDVPELPAGYYRVALEMSSQGQVLGGQTLAIIQLADANPPVRPDGRLGFVATSLPFEGWEQLPQVLPMLSAGRVKLALWSRDGDISDLESAKFDTLLQKLAEQGIRPTACLLDLPPSVLKRIGATEIKNSGVTEILGADGNKKAADSVPRTSSTWPLLLRANPKDWQPQLAMLIARHANHLDRWQIGEDGADVFVLDPNMRKVYSQVYAEFRKLVERPDVAMPWPAWYELDASAPSTIALSVPASVVLPQQVPLYLQDLSRDSGAATSKSRPADLSISLSWLDRDHYGRHEQLRDLAQRLIYVLSAGAERIDLPFPLKVRREQGAVMQEPTEELLVLRTIITTLGGATYRGRVPIADGVEAFLFDRAGQGILALWDRGAQSGVRELSVNLGASPSMIDLWGNVTPLAKIKGGKDGVSLKIGRMPVFLVDVDGQLMQTRASVAFDRPLIESSFQPHTRKLRFTNAYRGGVSGSVRLKAPAGWLINPPTLAFTLNAGETFEKDVTIEIPYNSVAGPKAIDAQFSLQAEGSSNFTVPIIVTLGLSDVGMQTIALRDGNDIIVQQMITNYSDKPINYTAFAVIQGQARQERLVNGLPAGTTTLKRYKFSGVEIKSAARVRAGVKETEGTRILNDEVMVR
jgi:hypothetical protein